ncbi:CoA-binding protein [Roseisalinus antarcticus]|uniref:CoA-binding domain-containing protein n=1 Tax=Roseisalinus antarcticus TaxID=254357 RepID=A0A1Y5SK38_9RHOB|nr:CoA-binding protein [Roseisalinus antarcticus]SLN40922.1 hypothetical protein ROA7023_01609 [Roseisalinus antarcticus]
MERDDLIRRVLQRTKTVAVVGFSANPARPSHAVAAFLQSLGWRLIPVNPGLAGQVLLGETVWGQLSEVPEQVDMVDVFRRSEAVAEIAREALARWPDLATLWLQLGVRDDATAEWARERGVTVIQDRCPRIEHARLMLQGG